VETRSSLLSSLARICGRSESAGRVPRRCTPPIQSPRRLGSWEPVLHCSHPLRASAGALNLRDAFPEMYPTDSEPPPIGIVGTRSSLLSSLSRICGRSESAGRVPGSSTPPIQSPRRLGSWKPVLHCCHPFRVSAGALNLRDAFPEMYPTDSEPPPIGIVGTRSSLLSSLARICGRSESAGRVPGRCTPLIQSPRRLRSCDPAVYRRPGFLRPSFPWLPLLRMKEAEPGWGDHRIYGSGNAPERIPTSRRPGASRAG
jgi:hypothetical protein